MIYKNSELYNVSEILESEKDEGKILTRIPNDLRISLNESAKLKALYPAGCEIRFNLEDGYAEVILRIEEDTPSIAEVFQGSFYISHHFIYKKPTEITVSLPLNIRFLDKLSKEKNLPFDSYLTRIVLPYMPGVRIVDIRGNISPPKNFQTPEKKYLAYGSSITHGNSAIRPTGTYAMKVAQLLGVDLINLGFGGGAHCERQMADYIAEREDWDFATLELGINMVNGFEVGEFKERVEYFISRIAKAHPDKWIFCIDIFTYFDDFISSSKKQNKFREVVRSTVENLNMPKLMYIDGRKLLKSLSGLCGGDLVHPSPFGMEEIAENLSKIIKEKI